METVEVTGGPLSIEDVVAVAHRTLMPRMGRAVIARMKPARDFVEKVVLENEVVYGVTTGFGALSSTTVLGDDARDLQYGLIRSHAAGVGDPLPLEHVRAMLLLRARTLAQGHSGIHAEFVERYLEMIERDIIPVVPAQGSVGASGDLAPFAHLALTVIGEGEVFDGGRRIDAATALARHGLEPLELMAKEGLSLLNGTEGMLAYGCLLYDRGGEAGQGLRYRGGAFGRSIDGIIPPIRGSYPRVATSSGPTSIGSQYCTTGSGVRHWLESPR